MKKKDLKKIVKYAEGDLLVKTTMQELKKVCGKYPNICVVKSRNIGFTQAVKKLCEEMGVSAPVVMTHAEFLKHMKENRGQHVDAGLPAENIKGGKT